jgi:glycosyltransferase involved in cell wall biosynthesis
MDITSTCLADAMRDLGEAEFAFTIVRPSIRRRLRLLYKLGSWHAFTADRLLHRFYDYPGLIREMRNDFDLFHIMDHSHAHLAHELPPQRTIVTCHDLDTFASLLDPARSRRCALFRAMTKRIWTGVQRATRIICVSEATRTEAMASGMAAGERLVVIPNGIQPLSSGISKGASDEVLERILGPLKPGTVELLHVGNNVPRKRLDVLLRVLAALRRQGIAARLIRVGDGFTREQLQMIDNLSLGTHISVPGRVSTDVLGAVYRRSTLLLQTSDAEGFGLPVVESMSLGTPVVASDIPALREVGGPLTAYCPVADIPRWTSVLTGLLQEHENRPHAWQQRQTAAREWARRFTWESAAEKTLSIYREIAYRARPGHSAMGPAAARTLAGVTAG